MNKVKIFKKKEKTLEKFQTDFEKLGYAKEKLFHCLPIMISRHIVV